ncbi:hypothetical protein FHL15_001190 [Xylaria flabelliformis]|uniref:NAD-dependent epimerase/dehydratase domain-containing protein n=1 Tax=Xylaria flabelliformis TaxID=2512241 RepID=A0A553ICR2_9PEZI|nr:hypothetical protein FHL15_001190 [Xylaria flabelliformis]
MTRILLTGGSGFVAAHVLETLLQRGHSVVTTVRSAQKGRHIVDAHPHHAHDTLDYVIVEDIAKAGAFDKAVVSQPPFEAVIHTASPYHFNSKDNQKELLEPESVYKYAPNVKRVVITSSSAAILDHRQPTKVYAEADWCPVTEEEALIGPGDGYRASKTFAERAAWKFVEEKNPSFSLTVRIRDIMSGVCKQGLPATGNYLFVDVRDLALGHALAVEKPEAANKRFFMVAGHFSNKEITEIIAEDFPSLRENLPSGDALKPGDYPAVGPYGFDNTRSKEVLGMTYRPLKESIVDAVKSLERFFEH